MSSRDWRAAFVIAPLAALCLGAAASPNLGVPATPDQLAKWDISVGPDGANLPPGTGSVAQGAVVYAQQCESCHGPRGQRGLHEQLTGGVGTLTSANPVKTVASYWPFATIAFDYIRRAMPLPKPESLTNSEVYSVVAYLLSIDGIVAPDAVLDAQSLPQVKMPNRDGFVNWYGKPAP